MQAATKVQSKLRYGEPGIETQFTQVDDTEYESYCERYSLSPDPRNLTRAECLAIAAGRECPDGAFIFAGTGLPLLGSMFAQHTYAPNAVLVMESGILGSKIQHLPISVSDPRASYQATVLSNMADAFGTFAMRGYCTLGILGGAECDKFGNINSTVIGDDGFHRQSGRNRQIRLAGSGGANPIASFADFIIAMMVHEKRRFPERCSYLTSPCGQRGKRNTAEDRASYGLYRGQSVVVVTTLGVLCTDRKDGELVLDLIYPGVNEDKLYANTGWALRKSDNFRVMPSPTYEELKVLRCVVDPTRIFLGRPLTDSK